MRLRLAVVGLAALGLGLGAGIGLAATDSGPPASATAIAVLVKLPDGTSTTVSAVSAPNGHEAIAGYAGGSARIASGRVTATTGPGSAPRANASVELSDVALFGGEITLGSVSVAATASADGGKPAGDLSAARVDGLTVLGQSLPAGVNQPLSLGFGRAVVLEQAVQSGGGTGYRGFVVALHVYLTEDHAGLPAGSEILVGYAETAVRASSEPAAEPETDESPSSPPSGGDSGSSSSSTSSGARDEPAQQPPGATGGPPPIVRNPPAGVRPQITGAGYVFPVYGHASFSNDFAAPRADTIWHHGNDIFAATGAPVLAVTDGTLFLVGWNTLGGHRLWLRDGQGNEYYYAHLSAYSPLAVDGASVRAGDVIGFVGESGASGGVPHLHFEVHPRALLGLGYDGVINPYTYLLAWYDRRDEAFGIVAPAGGAGPAPTPGAVFLGGQDISAASGLDAGAVERVFSSSGRGEGSALFQPASPPLVGVPPGF